MSSFVLYSRLVSCRQRRPYIKDKSKRVTSTPWRVTRRRAKCDVYTFAYQSFLFQLFNARDALTLTSTYLPVWQLKILKHWNYDSSVDSLLYYLTPNGLTRLGLRYGTYSQGGRQVLVVNTEDERGIKRARLKFHLGVYHRLNHLQLQLHGTQNKRNASHAQHIAASGNKPWMCMENVQSQCVAILPDCCVYETRYDVASCFIEKQR